MKEAAIGFGIGIIGLLCLYFFWFTPTVNNAREEGYQKGLNEIKSNTVYLPGEKIFIHDTTYLDATAKKPVKKSGDTLTTKFDSSFVSDRDTIGIKAKVSIVDSIAAWFFSFKHIKVKEFQTDTLRITIPKIVEVETKVTNWALITISYILGIGSAIALFILGK